MTCKHRTKVRVQGKLAQVAESFLIMKVFGLNLGGILASWTLIFVFTVSRRKFRNIVSNYIKAACFRNLSNLLFPNHPNMPLCIIY